MSQTPGALGRRYLPFIALAAVQVLLVAIAPSKVGTNSSATGLTTGGNQAAVGGQVLDENGQPVAGLTQQADGSFVDANGNVVSGGGGGAVNGATGKADLSKCDKTGHQIGPPGYKLMPPCVPVWHGGDNGGATMTGVTDKAINFLVYVGQGNAEVNAILATQGLAASTEQSCEAKAAFYKEINKGYWETYGRKFVAMDGPGANKGSTQQSPCNFPYFQGQCALTPPDPPCGLAEAKVIASMHPAFVIGSYGDVMSQYLASQHIIVLGGGSAPGEYYAERSPYYYGLLMDGYRQADLDAEYWCKRMNAKPAINAGADVKSTRNWGTTPGQVPVRKLAAIFPETNGDESSFLSVNRFKKAVTGGVCNTPGGVLMLPYQSDITTAQQQSVNVVQQLIDNHITTVACFCDPIAPAFLTQNMSKQHYFPENWIVGVGLMDYDVLGRLYDSTEWAHAFGASDLGTGQPFAQTDAARWWVDAGNSGQPDSTENAVLPFFSLMATSFQVAGSHPTPDSIHKGLVALDPVGSWQQLHDQHSIKVGFKPPSEWTATEDMREVNWSQTRVSEIDGKPGSYCPIDGGHRFDLGEWLKGEPDVFNPSKNGC
ncbi:MAG: hypothetical protein QOK28_152 [Actinomycetota bacterium]|jgi:hypothetical protein